MADKIEEREQRNSTQWFIVKELGLTMINGILVSITAFLLLELAEWPVREKLVMLSGDLAGKEWVQIGLIFIGYCWLLALTNSKWIGTSIILSGAAAMHIANTVKLAYRSEPVYPSDFLFLNNLPFLIDMAGRRNVAILFGVLAVIILITIFLVKKERKKCLPVSRPISWTMRGILFFLSSLVLFQAIQFNQPGNIIREYVEPQTRWIKFRQGQNYRENGFVLGFLYNLNAPAMSEPDGYSEETIQEIFEIYGQQAEEINAGRAGELDANILFVMNESFTDPHNLSALNVTGDPIVHTRTLIEENTGGKALAQSYGGGTANIEFEALTGISMEPLAPSLTTPYTQLTLKMQDLPSIPRTLKNQGYTTTAIHPHDTTMYKRVDVYNYMGFDRFLSKDEMKETMRYENNQYISDISSYNEALSVLDASSTPDFIHIVTMHNHVDFIDNYQDLEYKVEGVEDPEHSITQYYQGLSYSDQDLRNLVDELDNRHEDSILVFWGDHLPGIYEEEIFTKELSLDKYETPLLIYTTLDNSEQNSELLISPIYFMNHVLRLADAPVSPYIALLMQLEAQLPAFEKEVYVESDAIKENREQLSPETLKILEDYTMILYDMTTGQNYSSTNGFFEIIE